MFSKILIATTCLLASTAVAAPVVQLEQRGGSNKRGLSYNNPSVLAAFDPTLYSWAYNWGAAAGGQISGSDFVPMLWGPPFFGDWFSAANESICSGSKYMLAFNEPDLSTQADMSPQDAAAAYQEYMNPFAGKVTLGSPGVTNGQGNMGLTWLQSFFDACAGKCNIDFLAIHWYESAANSDIFKQYVSQAVDVANQNGVGGIWITEFRGDGDPAAQVNFINDVVPWLDAQDGVERYAYFMADDLVSGGQLTSVGQAYCSA